MGRHEPEKPRRGDQNEQLDLNDPNQRRALSRFFEVSARDERCVTRGAKDLEINKVNRTRRGLLSHPPI